MDDNISLNQKYNHLFLEHMAQDYNDIVSDHHKLKEAKETHCSIFDLEENKIRVDNRIARENTTFRVAVERINGTNDFVDVSKLQKIIELSKSVCRILKNGKPIGTGFLINSNIILTNHHVISSAEECINITVQFNYEINIEGKINETKDFRIDANSFFVTSSLDKELGNDLSGLDFTMVALEEINEQKQHIEDIPSLALDINLGKIIKGETCIIIQHPNGLPKKTTLNNNSFFSETDDLLIYETDTLPGSSGSLVIALGTSEVIALHQRGIPKLDEQGNIITKSGHIANSSTTDEEVEWLGNAGIKISRILSVVEKVDIPEKFNKKRNEILQKSKQNKEILNEKKENLQIPKDIEDTKVPKQIEEQKTNKTISKISFLVFAKNSIEIIQSIEFELREKYDTHLDFFLSMPLTAQEDKDEIFVLQMNIGAENPNNVARDLLKISGIKHAEYDHELAINNDLEVDLLEITESNSSREDQSSEEYFLSKYSDKSVYVKGKSPEDYRRWNWQAVGYSGKENEIIGNAIKIVQFDTGYVIHPKILGAYNLDEDFDFVGNDNNSHEDVAKKMTLADFGHGGRTGSIIVGTGHSSVDKNGNEGFLHRNQVKLIPYRVAQDVIILGRQAELASAVDSAIAVGAKVITTSMGLPPTLSTFQMSKKVYEKGIIWCCAAGNEVKNVVAPAVHEGTIAVAASNPLDQEWKGSSRGEEVDITAPGMHVYVPRFIEGGGFGMSYGHGTSYSTPHVASAAVLWLNKNREELKNYRGFQIVEAFRENLKNSARSNHNLPEGFGAGILNIDQLLKQKLPPTEQLKNRYVGKDMNAIVAKYKTVTESLKMLWNGFLRVGRKIFSDEENLSQEIEMSLHAKKMIEKYTSNKFKTQESIQQLDTQEMFEIYNTLRKKVTT